MTSNSSHSETNLSLRLLMIQDDANDARRFEEMLRNSEDVDVELIHTASVEAGLQCLLDQEIDAVLLDLSLEESGGIDTLAPARVAATTLPFVVLGDADDDRLALRAHRFGAQDYLVKHSCDTAVLIRTLRHAIERNRILQDLARARQYEHYLATHDTLTGLPNRHALMDQLRRAIASAARTGNRVGVLFLDLDRFKNINDSLGHGTGDELLRIVARRLSTNVRASDMVARLGGDEFIMLLQGIRRDQDPAIVARKITELMMTPCVHDGREFHITTSIGVAVFPDDGTDAELLIQNADTAMYHAKESGPNRFSYFSQQLNDSVTHRLDIENGLQDALLHNRLRVHFQPQVDVRLGTVTGAEALVRWQHPEQGLIPPSEFVPYAEEAGLTLPMGRWVLRAACEQAVRWPRVADTPLRLSVNVSTRQLCEEGFPETVAQILRETGFEAGRLELEITEHSVLQETGATLGAIGFLRDLGVTVSIDDFGTGYSSLNALKNLPVDGIKIDRSFVADLLSSDADATITRGLIGIAQGLGLDITAEGVENQEQLAWLLAEGVGTMQGYLFSKPLTAEEIFEQLEGGDPAWLDAIPD